MATELFHQMNAAEAAWNADEMNLDLLRASDAAYIAYVKAEGEARRQWDAIPSSAAKDSAANNAFDTEGTEEDKLHWFDIALRTYEMNIDCGYYNADGSDKN